MNVMRALDYIPLTERQQYLAHETDRLRAVTRRLQTELDESLTPEQRAWIAGIEADFEAGKYSGFDQLALN